MGIFLITSLCFFKQQLKNLRLLFETIPPCLRWLCTLKDSGNLTDCAPTHFSTSPPSPVSQVERSVPGSDMEDQDPERLDLKRINRTAISMTIASLTHLTGL